MEMNDKRKFALISGEEKFTLEDVKYLANTIKAKKVYISKCVNEEDCDCTETYGILLTRTKGSTDWSMIQKLFGVYDDGYESYNVLTIPLALYLGIIGQEDSHWQMEELFSNEEIEEWKKECEENA